MKGEMLTATAYPPPPPPPPPQAPPKKDSRKLLVVVLLIVIIVVSAVVVFYVATNQSQSSTNPTPSPSATPTGSPNASPTATPASTPSSTPSGNNPIVNLRVGAYVTYRTTVVTGEAESSTSTLKMSVDSEETYNGIACWVMSMTTETPTEGGTSKMIVTWWMSKTGLESLHIRMRIYINDVLTYDQEFDPEDTSATTGEPPEPIDPNTVVSYETVTVPAGTFTNCAKAEVDTGTSASTIWMHQDVPLWGMVKTETYDQGELQSTMELIAYGG